MELLKLKSLILDCNSDWLKRLFKFIAEACDSDVEFLLMSFKNSY